MRQIRQLTDMLDAMPFWLQIAIAIFLLLFTLGSVYARINLDFGEKFFSKVSRDEIRSNRGHMFQYTTIPAIATVGYFGLLLTKYIA